MLGKTLERLDDKAGADKAYGQARQLQSQKVVDEV
jgi:Flp pilus assembly protein TadD